ncbi:hypothetical protein [Candidatus Harpocratesius sp.]
MNRRTEQITHFQEASHQMVDEDDQPRVHLEQASFLMRAGL